MPIEPPFGGATTPVDNCRVGFFDYNDQATKTTPINVPGNLTKVIITNDGAGPFTNLNYKPTNVPNIWDTTTNFFDFTNLKLGDMVDIRLDVSVTTQTPNQQVIIDLDVAIGGSAYSIPFENIVYKKFRCSKY